MTDIKINNKSKNNELINYSNPENISFSNIITKDSYTGFLINNIFSVFKSIDNILLVIYTNINKTIFSYNLINNQILNKIKNAHEDCITSIRNYIDSINRRDLILSISRDNNIKIWDINFNCLVNLTNINKQGGIYSGTILNYNNQNYIISSNENRFGECDPIKIFDFKGNKINEINNSNYDTYIIDSYYDNNFNKNYIITGNKDYAISYDFNENKIYHKYFEYKYNYSKNGILIHNIDGIIKLIESNDEGIIKIWNFHNGELLKKINVINKKLYGICLWNNNNLFVGCEDKAIKLININNDKIIKSLSGHEGSVITIKKIVHPKYGECLISYGEDIILWKKN